MQLVKDHFQVFHEGKPLLCACGMEFKARRTRDRHKKICIVAQSSSDERTDKQYYI